MRIEIVNWAKYQPRHDIKSTTWFRLENTFWSDPALTPLDSDGKLVWIVLLAFASQKQSGVLDVDIEFVSAVTRVCPAKIKSCFEHFQRAGKIKIPTLRRKPSMRDATNERTDVTNETDETDDEKKTRVRAYDLSKVPNPNPKPKAPTYTETDMALGSLWLAHGCVQMPWMTQDKGWTQERFADAIARVRKATGLRDLEMSQVFAFLSTDEFWRNKAASPLGLLAKSTRNGQRKIDNILVSMQRPRSKTEIAAEAAKKWAEESDDNKGRLF